MQGRLGAVFTSHGLALTGSTTALSILKLLKAFRLIRLMKLLRIVKLQSLLSRYQDHVFLFAPMLAMGKQMAILVFLGHLAGCCFFFFSTSTWQTEVEREMIAAQDLTTWTQSELFANELYTPAVTQAVAESKVTEWLPAVDGRGSAAELDGMQLFCPKWYLAETQQGTWMCVSMGGFLPRYVAALYWVRLCYAHPGCTRPRAVFHLPMPRTGVHNHDHGGLR